MGFFRDFQSFRSTIAMLDHLPALAIVIFDRNYKYVSVSGGALIATNLRQLTGKTLYDLDEMLPGARAGLQPYYDRALAGESFEVSEYTSAVNPDEKYHCYFAPVLRGMDGRVKLAGVAIQNISAEVRLAKAEQKAAAAEDMETVLLEVSNIFANQATSSREIIERLRVLLPGNEDVKALSELLTDSFDAIAKLSDLAGLFILHKTEVGLYSIAQSAVKGLDAVVFDCCENPTVSIDMYRIRRVIHDLTLNAIEASSTARIRVTKEPPRVEMFNPDPVHDLPTALKPFTSTKPGRMGLGLALAKINVEKHDGTFDIQSNESGTTVTLTFPETNQQKMEA